jgi:hypothetical protein
MTEFMAKIGYPSLAGDGMEMDEQVIKVRQRFTMQLSEVIASLPNYKPDNLRPVLACVYWRWLHTRAGDRATAPVRLLRRADNGQVWLTAPRLVAAEGRRPEIELDLSAPPTGPAVLKAINVCLERWLNELPEIRKVVSLGKWREWWGETVDEVSLRGEITSGKLSQQWLKKIRTLVPGYSMTDAEIDRLDTGEDRIDVRRINQHLQFGHNLCKLVIFPLSYSMGVIDPIWMDYEIWFRDAQLMLYAGEAANPYDSFSCPDGLERTVVTSKTDSRSLS